VCLEKSIEIRAVTRRKRIQKYEEFGLQLTQAERKLIVDGVLGVPQDLELTIRTTPAKQPVMMTLDNWDELGGYVAAEANNTGDKKLQKKFDAIFSKIQDLLDSQTDDESSLTIRQPLTEESVQLAEWAATMLIGAEQLGIKTKTVTQFPLPAAHQSILMKLPIVSPKLQAKLATKNLKLTVGEVGGLLIAVCEVMMDASPLQQFALILITKSLRECLEAEVRGGVMRVPGDLDDE
jgi:hypothetical protein